MSLDCLLIQIAQFDTSINIFDLVFLPLEFLFVLFFTADAIPYSVAFLGFLIFTFISWHYILLEHSLNKIHCDLYISQFGNKKMFKVS